MVKKETIMISVIIPAYNAGRHLEKALNSVLNQSFQDFEIIIINDGSTDNTEEVAKRFNDERIKYIYQENQGISSARNKGIELSRGEFIAFLDADDFWHPEKLQTQLTLIHKNPNICFVYSYIKMIEESTGTAFIKTFDNFKTQEKLLKNLILTPFNTSSPSTVMIKKECLSETGLFDTNIKVGEDLDLWLRIAIQGINSSKPGHSNFYCIKKPLATAIRPQSGITRSMDPLETIKNNSYILNKFFNETDKEKKFQKYRNLAFAFIYFNIGFHYFFANNAKERALIKNHNPFFVYIKTSLRKIINFYISLI